MRSPPTIDSNRKAGRSPQILEYAPQWRFAICSQVEVDGYSVSLLGESFKFRSGGLNIHKQWQW